VNAVARMSVAKSGNDRAALMHIPDFTSFIEPSLLRFHCFRSFHLIAVFATEPLGIFPSLPST
jgi:hypothetical protein